MREVGRPTPVASSANDARESRLGAPIGNQLDSREPFERQRATQRLAHRRAAPSPTPPLLAALTVPAQ
jgi:hypothetical protein